MCNVATVYADMDGIDDAAGWYESKSARDGKLSVATKKQRGSSYLIAATLFSRRQHEFCL